MTIGISAIVCAVVAGFSPLLLRPILSRSGILDVPNARSGHSTPKLRGMGIAPLAGMLIGALAAPASPQLWLIVGASAAMAVIGLADDVRNLSARARFAMQSAIGVFVGVTIALIFDVTWWVVPAATIVFAAFVNMSNFMDGANGISALFGALAGTAFMAIGIVTDRGWLSAVGVLVGVGFLLFLPWNIGGAGMFLGDCGSYLLGAGIATAAVAAVASGVPWPTALAPMAVYATDTTTTIASRAVRGERWWEAHRQHLYQQLIDSGWTHMGAALWLAMFVALAVAGGMIALLNVPGSAAVSACVVLAVCAAYVLVGRLMINRRRRARL